MFILTCQNSNPDWIQLSTHPLLTMKQLNMAGEKKPHTMLTEFKLNLWSPTSNKSSALLAILYFSGKFIHPLSGAPALYVTLSPLTPSTFSSALSWSLYFWVEKRKTNFHISRNSHLYHILGLCPRNGPLSVTVGELSLPTPTALPPFCSSSPLPAHSRSFFAPGITPSLLYTIKTLLLNSWQSPSP